MQNVLFMHTKLPAMKEVHVKVATKNKHGHNHDHDNYNSRKYDTTTEKQRELFIRVVCSSSN